MTWLLLVQKKYPARVLKEKLLKKHLKQLKRNKQTLLVEVIDQELIKKS